MLVGTNTSDDAGVYKVSDELALVQTVDYFTPVVDDPYAFGAIAAANALSDVYAMGGRPVLALNIVGFPSTTLPLTILQEILRGGSDKAREAGVSIIGGHSIDDAEPKYGMAVTGFVHPDRIVTNAGAQPGDALILTKPLGIGILTTAIKRQRIQPEVAELAVTTMAALNRVASEVMQQVGVHAATDVTGYGLLGHLRELAAASGLSARVHLGQVPVLPTVFELAAAGVVPGGSQRNWTFLQPFVTYAPDLAESEQLVLADAQTSGGLLIAIPEARADELLAALHAAGVTAAARVGEVFAGPAGQIGVLR